MLAATLPASKTLSMRANTSVKHGNCGGGNHQVVFPSTSPTENRVPSAILSYLSFRQAFYAASLYIICVAVKIINLYFPVDHQPRLLRPGHRLSLKERPLYLTGITETEKAHSNLSHNINTFNKLPTSTPSTKPFNDSFYVQQAIGLFSSIALLYTKFWHVYNPKGTHTFAFFNASLSHQQLSFRLP